MTYAYRDSERAVNEANEVLLNLETDQPALYHFPLPIYDVCRYYGFQIDLLDLDTTSGVVMVSTNKIEGYDSQKVIVLNSEISPSRRIFTAAHELGHYLLHGNNGEIFAHRDDESMNNNRLQEKEANDFAANLLMPTKEMKKAINNFNNGDFTYPILKFHIADYFGVSVPAAEQRIINYDAETI